MLWIKRHAFTLGFVAAVAVFALAVVALGVGLTQAKEQGKANKRALFVGCTLLANTIIQTGAANTGDEANRLFIEAIQRVMTPAERVKFREALASRQPTGRITVPSCRRISEHPEEVRAIPLKTPTRTPTPSPTP